MAIEADAIRMTIDRRGLNRIETESQHALAFVNPGFTVTPSLAQVVLPPMVAPALAATTPSAQTARPASAVWRSAGRRKKAGEAIWGNCTRDCGAEARCAPASAPPAPRSDPGSSGSPAAP